MGIIGFISLGIEIIKIIWSIIKIIREIKKKDPLFDVKETVQQVNQNIEELKGDKPKLVEKLRALEARLRKKAQDSVVPGPADTVQE